MDCFSLSSHPFSPSFLTKKPPKFSSSLSLSPESDPHPPSSAKIRRPQTPTTLKTTVTKPTHITTPPPLNPPLNSKIPKNPLRNLINTSKPPTPPSNPLSNKLWLSSRISPPEEPLPSPEITVLPSPAAEPDDPRPPAPEFRQEGKIFVGNLPLWIKKNEIAEFFRQLGPVKNVVLIKGHDDMERNVGFCFVIYGGPTAASAAAKAVEFDGVEFRGRVLTVRLDDGRRLKERAEERSRWAAAADGSPEVRKEYRSKWHEEREVSRKEFRRVVESEQDNWQAVVSAFQRVKKPSRGEFGLMAKYYARRGDKHNARATFESMRARGIEPNSYVYTNLVNAYAVARDMRGALACVEEMKDEDIEMSVVTYSILIKGFNNIGDAE
eukprot:TRINITY_DN8517_c0_g1_i1.p1 TRINITY_DN8517_c0_g1~~TRINITY_DN8517_c0_g1_i1.p1  ORF type:complete len:395 (+),score=88.17 TRINITY_DN8517_c0_g1_i1:43-1185(+)